MTGYWRFFRRETALAGYGLSLTFLSSLGQTFLVSLFVPHFLEDFALSEAGFGTLYSGATLTSALLLPWVGQWLDRVRLDRFTLGVTTFLALSTFLVAGAWHVAALGAGLLGLRLGGQGLSSHTAHTAMGRYFRAARGKALGLTNLGYPLGEAVFPLLLTGVIAWLGWRTSWAGLGILALLSGPVMVMMLRRSGAEMDPRSAGARPGEERAVRAGSPGADGDQGPPGAEGAGAGDAASGADGRPERRQWSRSEVLGDVRFWCALPAALLPGFWVTAFFLYQTTIADIKGWSLAMMASSFTAFAATRVAFTLGVGEGIDRASARRIFPLTVLPMGVGIGALWLLDGVWVAYTFMAFLGVTMGLGPSVQTALWAELYGTRHLGAIRSMMTSLVVVSTAASPALAGFVLEEGPGLDPLLGAGVVSVLGGALLALRILPRYGSGED